MGSDTYHEPYELLSDETKNYHRAIVSLIEELEAVDWYQQRASVCPDADLKATLLHHPDEEIEHAMMNLEWLRRNDPVIDRNARLYLFSSGPITEVEEKAKTDGTGNGSSTKGDGDRGSAGLGIGSLRQG